MTKSYDVLNARQYRDLMEENGAVSGLPADLTDRTDWFDETYSTGVNQNYQFSVSNGDENSSYYLGGGYTNEKGIINTTSSDRYNVKASFDKKIFKWVSANASTTFSHYTTKGTIISGQGANRAGAWWCRPSRLRPTLRSGTPRIPSSSTIIFTAPTSPRRVRTWPARITTRMSPTACCSPAA